MARPNVFGLIFKVDATEQKKFDEISKKMRGMSNTMNKSLGGSFMNLQTLATGFFAAVATSKIAGAVNDFALMGDRIAKTSNTLGVGVEALQELEYVAGQQGASTEALNSGFQNLNKNIGMMTVGSGKLYAYLKKGNPELLKQVKAAKNSEEAFSLLTDAIGKETDVSRRAALATAAFGGSAQDMIKFSKGGKESIDALREAKRRFGVISEDAAKASEAFNDAQDDLGQAVKGLTYGALAPLLPKLTELIKLATDWVVANKDIINSGVETFFSILGGSLKILVALWDSGLLPVLITSIGLFKLLQSIIMAGRVAWISYTAAMTLANGSTLLMVKAWLAANAAFLMSPIGLVIAGLIALVAVGYLVYKNWDYLVQKAGEFWEWLKKLWNESETLQTVVKALGIALAIALSPVLIPIAAIIAGFYGMYKAYQWVKSKISGEPIDVNANIPGVGSGGAGGLPGVVGPQSANQGVINSNSTTTNRSQLDVNIGGLPKGSSVNQRGSAPNITVNTGYGASRP